MSKESKEAMQKISYWKLINTWYGGNLTHHESSMKKLYLNEITKVIFNDPATIVFWRDGTKTVVKCNPGDTFDPEKGLAMACTKKLFGNNGFYYDIFRKWLPEEEKEKLIGLDVFDALSRAITGSINIRERIQNLAELAKEKEDK